MRLLISSIRSSLADKVVNVLFRICCSGLLLLGLVGDGNTQAVEPPPEEGIAYVVRFIEVVPRAADAVASALQTYRDVGRQQEANLELQVYQEIGPQYRFMVAETWREEADFRAYAQQEAAGQLRDALAAVQLGPPDVRVHRAFTVGAPVAPSSDVVDPSSTVYVQTHLDVAPPFFSGLASLLEPFVEASREDRGELRFDLLQHVAPRQNHLTLMEAWRTEADLDAHRIAPHTREFREGVLPILGSLYDERLYRLVD